jgi:pectinesterase
MKVFKEITVLAFLLTTLIFHGQEKEVTWKSITERKDESWFASEEAKKIAENVLLYQRDIGGWPKNIEMQNELSEKEIKSLLALKSDPNGCTIDNGATSQEMMFLSKIYKQQPDEKYKIAFLKAVLYLVSAQYKNGGWPQFFPLKKGYYTHITYNDNAMVNILKIFQDIKNNTGVYSIEIPEEIVKRIEVSFNKGIECIIKTQYRQYGKLTAWCAQHDKETLKPAGARAYELPSLSGKESAKIVLLLMSIENPSPEVVHAIESSVKWFEKTKIEGIKIEVIEDEKGQKDRVVVQNSDAEPLWARFMELEDNTPFFCDRSGKKKYDIAEISHERRNGYAWYTNEPKEVLKKYDAWKKSITK